MGLRAVLASVLLEVTLGKCRTHDRPAGSLLIRQVFVTSPSTVLCLRNQIELRRGVIWETSSGLVGYHEYLYVVEDWGRPGDWTPNNSACSARPGPDWAGGSDVLPAVVYLTLLRVLNGAPAAKLNGIFTVGCGRRYCSFTGFR